MRASKFLGKAKELWDHISHMNETFVTEGDFIQILVGILKKVPGVPIHTALSYNKLGTSTWKGIKTYTLGSGFLEPFLLWRSKPTTPNKEKQTPTWATTILDATTVVQKTTRLHNARNPEEETNQHGKEDHRRNNKNTPHQPIAMMATTEEEEAKDQFLDL